MGNFWTRVWIWTKVTVFAVAFFYVLFFVIFNLGNKASVWYSYHRTIEADTLTIALVAFIAGVVCTVLIRTGTVTLRQLRDARERALADRTAREAEEMRLKAAMLQPKAPGDSPAKT